MSEYKFKNLSEISTVAEPAEGTTMMGFENGVPIQMPMAAVKGSGNVFIINPDDPEYSTTDTAYGNKVKEALLGGKQVWEYFPIENLYSPVIVFGQADNSGEPVLAIATAVIRVQSGSETSIKFNTGLAPTVYALSK